MTEKTASQLEDGDQLVVNDLEWIKTEEVPFTAWSDDGDVLVWTDECDVTEPIRLDESTVVQVSRENGA